MNKLYKKDWKGGYKNNKTRQRRASYCAGRLCRFSFSSSWYRSQCICSVSQNSGSVLKKRASFIAVEGVIERFPTTSSLTLLLEIPKALARWAWEIERGCRNLESKNAPGWGALLQDFRKERSDNLASLPNPLFRNSAANFIQRLEITYRSKFFRSPRPGTEVPWSSGCRW